MAYEIFHIGHEIVPTIYFIHNKRVKKSDFTTITVLVFLVLLFLNQCGDKALQSRFGEHVTLSTQGF